jgi:hypothetical protein
LVHGSVTDFRLSVLSWAWVQVWLAAPTKASSRPSSSNVAVCDSFSVLPGSLIRRAVMLPRLLRSSSIEAPVLSSIFVMRRPVS